MNQFVSETHEQRQEDSGPAPSLTLQGEMGATPGVLYSCRQVTGQAQPLLRIRASPQELDPGEGLLGAWPGLLPRLALF